MVEPTGRRAEPEPVRRASPAGAVARPYAATAVGSESNCNSSSTNRSGASTCGQWPMPRSSSSREPGTVVRTRSAPGETRAGRDRPIRAALARRCRRAETDRAARGSGGEQSTGNSATLARSRWCQVNAEITPGSIDPGTANARPVYRRATALRRTALGTGVGSATSGPEHGIALHDVQQPSHLEPRRGDADDAGELRAMALGQAQRRRTRRGSCRPRARARARGRPQVAHGGRRELVELRQDRVGRSRSAVPNPGRSTAIARRPRRASRASA